MKNNPGLWIVWGDGMASGPNSASRLRGLGFEAKNLRLTDGTWKVWARQPPLIRDQKPTDNN